MNECRHEQPKHKIQESPKHLEEVSFCCFFEASNVIGRYDVLNWTIWTPMTCGFRRTALLATHLMPHWIFSSNDLRKYCAIWPLDLYFLWGFFKSLVFAGKPQSVTQKYHKVRQRSKDFFYRKQRKLPTEEVLRFSALLWYFSCN